MTLILKLDLDMVKTHTDMTENITYPHAGVVNIATKNQ